MKSNETAPPAILTTGTKLSDSSSWLFSLIRQIREIRRERRNPIRAQITATPIDVKEIWSRKDNHVPGLLSLLAHVSVITVLIVLSVAQYTKLKPAAESSALLERFTLSLPHSLIAGGGGGGGTRSPTFASKGVVPRASDRQFVPPTAVIMNMSPELMAEPTIIQLAFTNLTRVSNLLQLGDPNGLLEPPSSGKGRGGGIGNLGDGRGDGDHSGPAGPGCCGGPGDGESPHTFRAGDPGITNPTCPVQVEPNYSDDARKARIQGVVLLAVTVQKDGSIEPNQVLQGLGYGLDDEAKKVLNKWKCNPGKYNGQAVAVPIQIKINFHLY